MRQRSDLSMRIIALLSCLGVIQTIAVSQQGVAINTDGSAADASAVVDIKSTDQGMLIPRMTQAQRNLISMPATGLMVFQTDNTPGFYYYTGTVWSPVTPSANTSRYYSISAAEMQPWQNSTQYQKDTESLNGLVSSQATVFFAPIHLPQGSVITNITAYVDDADASNDITVTLYAGSLTEAIGYSSGSAGAQTVDLTGLTETINNTVYSYSLRVDWTTGTTFTQLKFYRATITYTATSLLP